MSIKRYFRWYDKKDCQLLGEIEISCPLNVLQQIFEVDIHNPMYDSWSVTENHLDNLTKYIDTQIEIDLYDYFIEADLWTEK